VFIGFPAETGRLQQATMSLTFFFDYSYDSFFLWGLRFNTVLGGGPACTPMFKSVWDQVNSVYKIGQSNSTLFHETSFAFIITWMGFHMDGPLTHYGTLSHICHVSCATCQYRVRDSINRMVLGRSPNNIWSANYMYETALFG